MWSVFRVLDLYDWIFNFPWTDNTTVYAGHAQQRQIRLAVEMGTSGCHVMVPANVLSIKSHCEAFNWITLEFGSYQAMKRWQLSKRRGLLTRLHNNKSLVFKDWFKSNVTFKWARQAAQSKTEHSLLCWFGQKNKLQHVFMIFYLF